MTVLSLRETLETVVSGHHLTEPQAEHFLSEVLKGNVSEISLSSFLTALKMKGETREELSGFVRGMRNHAVKPTAKFDFDFIDTCGTGGDGKGSLNVSTLSALTLASLGVPVAKHGNRSVSSLSGSSDVLAAVGYSLEKSPDESVDEFLKKGFVFLFAPSWHPAMKYAGPVRKELGFRTFFNLIGPLSNPFFPTHQIVGVYHKSLTSPICEILRGLGAKKAIVCHSQDGLDEFSIFSTTNYTYFTGNSTEELGFDPSVLRLREEELDPRSVFSDSKEGAIALFRSVLSGEKPSAGLSMVALNAGVALFLFGRVSGIEEGYLVARDAILSKKVQQFARETLNLT
ncbi:MAG: anthranilate phosphoribosyltransferase [Leptospira sp.]|nr:anthranilate phosphoribosyltransferase [Leptospira sp.]